MQKFFEEHKNDVLRYWECKRMWTPYDMECKDPYQSEYVNDECSFGYMVEIYDLGNDWLIGFSSNKESKYVEYLKLSNIAIAYSAIDQE